MPPRRARRPKQQQPRARRPTGARARRRRRRAPPTSLVPVNQVGSRSRGGFRRPRRSRIMSLSAYSSSTLGLIQPTAPYSFLTVTKVISSDARVIVFGTFATETSTGTAWCPVISLSDVNHTAAINATGNTFLYKFSNFDGLGAASEYIPAALTVKVTNPNALQVTSGTVQLTRVQGNTSYGGSTTVWDTAAEALLSNCKPRIVSAAELAMKPLYGHGIPNDFTEMARFDRLIPSTDTSLANPYTWSTQAFHPAGFTPLLVYNNIITSGTTTPSPLTYEVTAKWRVRVTPDNPFSSTHVYQPVTSPSVWQSVVAQTSAHPSGFDEAAALGALWLARARRMAPAIAELPPIIPP